MTFRLGGKLHTASLVKNGGEITVILVDGIEAVFDHDFSAGYRHKKTGALTKPGLKALAIEALRTREKK